MSIIGVLHGKSSLLGSRPPVALEPPLPVDAAAALLEVQGLTETTAHLGVGFDADCALA